MNAPFPPPPPQANDTELLGPLPARRVVRKAVILAAGRGRRMGKLTKDRPKAALVVGDHALIDWQIAALQAAGVEDIAVVTGHGAQALAGRGVTYIHNPDWTQGTQVDSLLCARDWIGDEPVIVSYGDIIYHPSAALALLERPGDIVVAYDADHRWLWKARFGDWLKDSETFRLGPGQVLTEIGGKPTDIEALDGQFMGLMLFTAPGLAQLLAAYSGIAPITRLELDFTRLLSRMVEAGGRIDTAACLVPWMEVDSPKDHALAHRMTRPDLRKGIGPDLVFPCDEQGAPPLEGGDEPDATADLDANHADPLGVPVPFSPESATAPNGDKHCRKEKYLQIREYKICNAFAVQNWGRSGSTFVQSLFDGHPQVISTPNFYSRRYYVAWADTIAQQPDSKKLEVFLRIFQQWWDTGLVDPTAGLHRLGSERRQLAGVEREALEGYLRAAFPEGRSITRRNLFEAGHMAYALARGQIVATRDLQILFPIHGEPRGVAAALLEDFPEARFIHTIRDPAANVASSLQHLCFNNFDLRNDPLEATLLALFGGHGRRYGRVRTSFDIRPYFPHLLARDAFRFLRLEDLHTHGAALMSSAASWLGLGDAPTLIVSTWDGQLWWNRPESGPDSRLGGGGLGRNNDRRLGLADYEKIQGLARNTEGIREAYVFSSPGPTLWNRLRCLVIPWRQEGLNCSSEHRSLEALLDLSRILPKRFVMRLEGALERERHRARLLEMMSGAIGVRKKLSNFKKPGTIQGVLLLSPTETGWRIRALASVRTDILDQSDRLAVAFLDEATARRSVRGFSFWLIVLTFGVWIAALVAWIRIRLLMLRLTRIRPASSALPLPILSPVM